MITLNSSLPVSTLNLNRLNSQPKTWEGCTLGDQDGGVREPVAQLL